MAPKRRPDPKTLVKVAPAELQDVASPSGVAGSSCGSLLEEAMEQQTPSKRRMLKRMTTDEQVAKAIKDNFKSWTATEVDMNRVNNKTLRETLLEDKRKAKKEKGAVAFGSSYYFELVQADADAGSKLALEMLAPSTRLVSSSQAARRTKSLLGPTTPCLEHWDPAAALACQRTPRSSS